MTLPIKQLSSALHKLFFIGKLSIKKLALFGFILVALPLVMALLYSVAQINHLSKQGADAVFDVAKLISINRELSDAQAKMERFASQYLVLNDTELRSQYFTQAQQFNLTLARTLFHSRDAELTELSAKLADSQHQLSQLLNATAPPELSLMQLQQHFKPMSALVQRISVRTDEIIQLQARDIKISADHINAMLLKSLAIIPIITIIAGLFIYLISMPLKKLLQQIKRLTRGNFEQAIELTGAPEINEIAQALDVMRTRLHALELQKSSFIRHISHELKTPLAAIREGTALLYDNSVGTLNTEQAEVCQIIKSSVNRLQRLIEDLLDFNIVLDSTSLQDSEKLALPLLLAQVIAARQLDIKRKHLRLIVNIPKLIIFCNNRQLNVILDNLLSNAIKYSPEHGAITIEGKIDNSIDRNQLVLSVIDQGHGIAPAVQSKVFDAFFQGPAPENSQIKSSGLGLTITKELIMRLNGQITLHSTTSMPSGTNVTIALPRAYLVDDDV